MPNPNVRRPDETIAQYHARLKAQKHAVKHRLVPFYDVKKHGPWQPVKLGLKEKK